jgi:hypothetical protein
MTKEFRDLLKLQRDGLGPHQIVERLADMAHDFDYRRFTTGALQGIASVPDNAAIVLPSDWAIRLRAAVWEHAEAAAA